MKSLWYFPWKDFLEVQLLDPEPQGTWAPHSLSFLGDSEDPCVGGWGWWEWKFLRNPRSFVSRTECCERGLP